MTHWSPQLATLTHLLTKGKSVREIAKQLDIPKSTVFYWLKYAKKPYHTQQLIDRYLTVNRAGASSKGGKARADKQRREALETGAPKNTGEED